MRKALLTFGFVLVGTVVLYAATHITTGAATPAVCNAGDIFYKTGASAGLHACSAANTWTRVAFGTTDISAPTDDSVMLGSGTAWQTKAIADCDDTTGKHLNYDTTTNAFSCGTSASGGSGTVTHTGALTAENLIVGNGTDDVKILSGLTDDAVIVANGTAWQLKVIGDCDDTGGNHLNYDTTTNAFTCGTSGSGAAGALSGLSAAVAANTIASGNNYEQIWNWALTTAAKQAMIFGETTAATNGGVAASTTQAILSAKTIAASTAIPLYIVNAGGGPSLRVDDVAADTTPFCVDSGGSVNISGVTSGCAPRVPLDVGGSNGAYTAYFDDGTDRIGVFTDTNKASIGTVTAHPFSLFSQNSNPRLMVRTSTTGSITIMKHTSPPTSISTGATGLDQYYLTLGGDDAVANGYYLIGFGYTDSVNSGASGVTPPAYIGFQEISNTSNTQGDLVFGTRNATTDTAPTERMRILADGTVNIANLTTTGAATGKKIVCVDTATGKLYASTSDVQCLN